MKNAVTITCPNGETLEVPSNEFYAWTQSLSGSSEISNHSITSRLVGFAEQNKSNLGGVTA